MHLRQGKSVPIDPMGVLGIESHELVKEDMSYRGHAHRSSRMTGICSECCVDLGKRLAVSDLPPKQYLNVGIKVGRIIERNGGNW